MGAVTAEVDGFTNPFNPKLVCRYGNGCHACGSYRRLIRAALGGPLRHRQRRATSCREKGAAIGLDHIGSFGQRCFNSARFSKQSGISPDHSIKLWTTTIRDWIVSISNRHALLSVSLEGPRFWIAWNPQNSARKMLKRPRAGGWRGRRPSQALSSIQ